MGNSLTQLAKLRSSNETTAFEIFATLSLIAYLISDNSSVKMRQDESTTRKSNEYIVETNSRIPDSSILFYRSFLNGLVRFTFRSLDQPGHIWISVEKSNDSSTQICNLIVCWNQRRLNKHIIMSWVRFNGRYLQKGLIGSRKWNEEKSLLSWKFTAKSTDQQSVNTNFSRSFYN